MLTGERDWSNVQSKKERRVRRIKENENIKTTQINNNTEYLLNNYKIRMCRKPKDESHDILTCINAHCVKELRRLPFNSSNHSLRYSKNLCSDMVNTGYCQRGENCLESHNTAEQHFHPTLYRTVLCKRGSSCHIHFCYYAHGKKELRKFDAITHEVKKERAVSFSEFVVLSTKESNANGMKHNIEVITNWAGWRKTVGAASEISPCPLDDVFTRMLYKYNDIQIKVRDICLKEGCTPYLEESKETSKTPVFLMLCGKNQNGITNATMSIQQFMESCRTKTKQYFSARFLNYVENDEHGIFILKKHCLENKGIDISIGNDGEIVIWGSNENKRHRILLELEKSCNEMSLKDATSIVEARLISMKEELQKVQQELQSALTENQKLKKKLSSTDSLVTKLKKDQAFGPNSHNLKPKLPPHWQSSDDYQEYRLEEFSGEWHMVKTKWLATIGQFQGSEIKCITRIENHHLWNHYSLTRESISNEKELWHGTRKESLAPICKKGFNRSYAGMNATMYGIGTYFARDSNYSVRYASRDWLDDRYMILAKVLVGRYMQGDRNLKEPPEGYNSAVNSLLDPSIFVLFKDYQAYPAYIVKFR